MIAGIYRVIDIISLWSVFLLCLPPSLALSTLSRPQRVGDLERALPQTTLLPTARQGQCIVPRSQASFRLILSSLP